MNVQMRTGVRAAISGGPNYFPNDADEESGEEESDDTSLVENDFDFDFDDIIYEVGGSVKYWIYNKRLY